MHPNILQTGPETKLRQVESIASSRGSDLRDLDC